EQRFQDVWPSDTFYDVIQQLASRGYIGGYPCGQNDQEPCVSPGNRPYFRLSANTTRGQLSKIVSKTAQYNDAPGAQNFADVPEGSPFFVWVQRLSNRGVVSGYPCGGTNPATGAPELCDASSRPYFRVNNNVTRGQTAKIVARTFFPNCQTEAPARK
ncbi:MAG TPA: S-layer homology domain-containing protein, partial [Chloroflexia bacterium]